MALVYGKKCMGVAGRRRLVVQPGGLTLGFAARLVYKVFLHRYLRYVSDNI